MSRWLLPAVVLILCAGIVHADRGSVPVSPDDIVVYEPGQKAAIAWNGQTEILYLSTDIFASSQSEVIEILPLPSEPKIEKGDPEVLKKFEKFIQQHLRWPDKPKTEGRGEELAEKKGIEIISFQQIGAHSITTLKVKDVDEFLRWMKDYLDKKQGKRGFWDSLRRTIKHYVDNGILFYAFDVITARKDKQTVEPLLYTFESCALYYPLKISSLVSGDTDITLVTVTEYDTGKTNFPRGFRRLGDSEIPISHRELSAICREMGQLFADKNLSLSVWKYNGSLQIDCDIPDIEKLSSLLKKESELLYNEADKRFADRDYPLAFELYRNVADRYVNFCPQVAERAKKKVEEIRANPELMVQIPKEEVEPGYIECWWRALNYRLNSLDKNACECLRVILGKYPPQSTYSRKAQWLLSLTEKVEKK
jgi:hypothetical protein